MRISSLQVLVATTTFSSPYHGERSTQDSGRAVANGLGLLRRAQAGSEDQLDGSRSGAALAVENVRQLPRLSAAVDD